MGVSSTTNRMDYTGDGSDDTFSYSFKIFNEDELLVTVVKESTGEETTLAIDTDYTVTGSGEAAGGTVVLVDADQVWLDASGDLDTGYNLTIRRVLPLVQEAGIRDNGAYFASLHEDQFDRSIMIDQQQQDELDRSIKVPETEEGTGLTIPSATARAGKLLGFDEDGDPVATSVGVDTAIVSAFIETLLDDADAATARTTLDAARATTSMTAETAGAANDLVSIYDASATAERKMTLENFFASQGVVTSFPSAGKSIGRTGNIGFAAVTNSNANDSLKLQGAAATLSALSPLLANMPSSATAGLLVTLSLTADVTVLLTGAHWGWGTKGNLTSVPLRTYLINDTGVLKVGIGPRGGLRAIADTATSATPSSVITFGMLLVNSALNSGTWPCIEVGDFLANFNDTGDIWAVLTSAGSLNPGTAPVVTDVDTGVLVLTGGNGHGSTNNKIRRFTGAESNTQRWATYADSAASGGSITMLRAGLYFIQSQDRDSANNAVFGVSVNSNQLTTEVGSITDAHRKAIIQGATAFIAQCSTQVRLFIGDIVRAHTAGTQDGTDTAQVRFYMTRVGD